MSGFSGSGGGGSLTPSFDFKASVRAATVIALPAYVQVGNVLTEVGVGALPLIDTVALVNTNRLLVKNEGGGTSIANGIYDVTSVGSGIAPWVLTRSADADINAEVTAGMIVPVEEGAVNADTLWILATNNPIVLNVTPLTFVTFGSASPNASTVVKGIVEIGTLAETYAGTPYLGGTGAVLVPSITNLLVRRQDPANALFTIATGIAPAARGAQSIDFQSYRSAAAQVASGANSFTFGRGNTASGAKAIATGTTCLASADYASAFGYNNDATYNSCSAIGHENVASVGVRASAFGSRNIASNGHANAFGYNNDATALNSSAMGNDNEATATYAEAFGFNNTASANSASAFGLTNYAIAIGASAFGRLNHAEGYHSSCFGYANTAKTIEASAFGRGNLVGSALFTATSSSAFGYVNEIGQTANANEVFAGGYRNKVNNSQYASAVGVSNIVGAALFTGLKSSASGCRNEIGQTANADNSNAFGYFNKVNNAVSGGSAFGSTNLVGSAAFTATQASAFGHGNLVGQTANSNKSSAFGYNCTVDALSANAFGYKAVARITKTTNICGPQIVRKDDGEGAAVNFETFSGVCGLELSEEVDLTSAATPKVTVTIPAGASVWFDEVGLICTEVGGGGTITTQATISAGITGTPAKYLAAVLTTLLTAAKKRERYTTLLADDGEGSVTFSITAAAVLGTATTYKGRFYVKWSLIEDE
jgi:hypothetical protein